MSNLQDSCILGIPGPSVSGPATRAGTASAPGAWLRSNTLTSPPSSGRGHLCARPAPQPHGVPAARGRRPSGAGYSRSCSSAAPGPSASITETGGRLWTTTPSTPRPGSRPCSVRKQSALQLRSGEVKTKQN